MKQPKLWQMVWCLLLILPTSLLADVHRFDLGASDWKLNNHEGRKISSAEGVTGTVLEITGDGTYSNAWMLPGVTLEKIKKNQNVGILRFKARRTAGSGGGMTGIDFANFDIPITDEWKTFSLIFQIPAHRKEGTIRLGQWMISGTLQFAEVELLEASPSFAENGLGIDEFYAPKEKNYSFISRWGGDTGNYSRTLADIQVGYNTNRWCFGKNSSLTYRFDAPQRDSSRFFGGTFQCSVCYHTGGTLAVETSTDGQNWTFLGKVEGVGSLETPLPQWEKGIPTLWIRFSQLDAGSLQLDSMRWTGYLTPQQGKNVENVPSGTQTLTEKGDTYFWELLSGDPGFPAPTVTDLPKTTPGEQFFEKTLDWKNKDGKTCQSKVRCRYYVSDYYREDFGYLLSGNDATGSLWWCEATWKVTPRRKTPEPKASVCQLFAARNDRESFQIVRRPSVQETLQSITFSPLKNADGDLIPAENIDLRQVCYHFVQNPTDATGVSDFYPDALPPLALPATLEAAKNFPLWITFSIPSGTPAGDYSTVMRMTFQSQQGTQTEEVPIQLRVWNIDLPEKNHVETAFGYSPGTSWRYHGVSSDSDKRKINDLYFQLLSDYRISPYRPAPMDDYAISFVVDKEKPENSHAKIDFERFDREMERVLEKFHFTGLSLSLPGMGWGTFHERGGPSIQGYGEETPEFQAMFSSMVRQIESHLREKGWLDMAYVYWFDEPEPRDYDFVRDGMNLIKKYAPDLPTMLTEEPSVKTITENALGKVDIWCPVTPNFSEENAKLCRANGERFWWYVCCWPHAPYCTEFIDHNAVEMRTWLWQTWKYDVKGILIWASNWWTSDTAFPDWNSPQNPYEDPMSYVSGYSVPKGTKRFWGNGDGRLYYPPLSCATPSKTPNFELPVPSIRLAMLREGIEDYEMLYLLQEKLKNATPEEKAKYSPLLEVPAKITLSTTEFSTSPLPIYEHRLKVAEALEALSR